MSTNGTPIPYYYSLGAKWTFSMAKWTFSVAKWVCAATNWPSDNRLSYTSANRAYKAPKWAPNWAFKGVDVPKWIFKAV